MIQEANKFSVAFACVCHFILGYTCGISAGWACFHQLPRASWEDTSTQRSGWKNTTQILLKQSDANQQLSHTENCCVKLQMKWKIVFLLIEGPLIPKPAVKDIGVLGHCFEFYRRNSSNKLWQGRGRTGGRSVLFSDQGWICFPPVFFYVSSQSLFSRFPAML